MLFIVLQIRSEGTFELELVKFTNDIGYNADANCCNGVLYNDHCTSACRTFFRICLKEFQTNISPSPPCTFGSVTTPALGGNSFNISDNSHVAFNSPVQLNFEFAWPVSLIYFDIVLRQFLYGLSRFKNVLVYMFASHI